jgi:hypothetical protein
MLDPGAEEGAQYRMSGWGLGTAYGPACHGVAHMNKRWNDSREVLMKNQIIALAAMLLAAPMAHAANQDLGTYELQLSGLIDPDTFAGGEVDLDVGLGYFFADNTEFGGRFSFSDNDVVQTLGLGGFGEINVPTQNAPVTPYLGAGLGILSVDFDKGGSQSALVGSGYAGVKYFITADLAISAQANLELATDDVFDKDHGEADSTNFDVTLALRYFFDR